MNISINKNYLTVGIIGLVVLLVLGIYFLLGSSNNNSNDSQTEKSFQSISASDFKQKVDDGETIILDVRTAQEFASGKIGDAMNIDFYNPNFRSEIDKLDKNAKYAIYCKSGNRSGQTLKIMNDLGFTNVVDLKGGITAYKF